MDINITLIIILITCGISFWAWNNTELYNKLIFNPYSIFHKRQYYRIFTSALLHADIPHLVINMFVLYSFGNFIEQVYAAYIPFGLPMYVAMYILSIGAANIKTLIENKNNVWYNAVGASGAVSAVVFAFVLFAPKAQIYFFGILPIPAFLYGLLYLVYSQYMAKKGTDNIGHDAHFYGAVFGFVFTGLLRPELFQLFVSKIFNF
ncbi:MAG: rhomboid family intramembrane serine protease [Bacteroidia bacterium]